MKISNYVVCIECKELIHTFTASNYCGECGTELKTIETINGKKVEE